MRKILLASVLATLAMANAEDGLEKAAPTPKTGEPGSLLAALGEGYGPCVQTSQAGKVDWTRGEILASGEGKVEGASGQAVAMARRAARLVAARNAVLLMRGIRIDPDGSSPNLKDGDVAVEGTLSDFEERQTAYDPQRRTVSVTLRMGMYGFRGLVSRCGQVAVPAGPRWSPSGEPSSSDEDIDVVAVDARGTRFSPVMFPAIVTARGQRVFDCGDMVGGRLRQRAMAVYAVAAQRKGDDRPMSEPARCLFVKAAASGGKANGTLVLDEAALDTLGEHAKAGELMKQGRLVIIVNENR